jgi:hypothetical protein
MTAWLLFLHPKNIVAEIMLLRVTMGCGRQRAQFYIDQRVGSRFAAAEMLATARLGNALGLTFQQVQK